MQVCSEEASVPPLLRQNSWCAPGQSRLLRSGSSNVAELAQELLCGQQGCAQQLQHKQERPEAAAAENRGQRDETAGLRRGPESEARGSRGKQEDSGQGGGRAVARVSVNAGGLPDLSMFSHSPEESFGGPARGYDSLHQFDFTGGSTAAHLQDPGPIPDLWDIGGKGEGDFAASNPFPSPPGGYQHSMQPMFPAHFPSLYHGPGEGGMQGQGGGSSHSLALPPAVPASSWYNMDVPGLGTWRGLGPGHELASSSGLLGMPERRHSSGAPLPSLQARQQHSDLLARDPLHLALEEGTLSLPPAVPPFRSAASGSLLEESGRAAGSRTYLPHRVSPGGVRKPPSPGSFRPHSSIVRGILPTRSPVARGGPSLHKGPLKGPGGASPSRKPRPLQKARAAERLEASTGSDGESSAFTDGGSKRKKGPRGVAKRPKNKRNQCANCGTHVTPQWRVGPHGPRTLCNACGVRFKKGLPLTGIAQAAEAAEEAADPLKAGGQQREQELSAPPVGRSPSRRSAGPSVGVSSPSRAHRANPSPRLHRGIPASPKGEARGEMQLSAADLTYNNWR